MSNIYIRSTLSFTSVAVQSIFQEEDKNPSAQQRRPLQLQPICDPRTRSSSAPLLPFSSPRDGPVRKRTRWDWIILVLFIKRHEGGGKLNRWIFINIYTASRFPFRLIIFCTGNPWRRPRSPFPPALCNVIDYHLLLQKAQRKEDEMRPDLCLFTTEHCTSSRSTSNNTQRSPSPPALHFEWPHGTIVVELFA